MRPHALLLVLLSGLPAGAEGTRVIDLAPAPISAPLVGDRAAAAGAPAQTWAVMSGSTLKATLEGWARSGGWIVVWDGAVDYRLRASALFEGDFEAAATALIESMHAAAPQLEATLYRENRVLHVDARGAAR